MTLGRVSIFLAVVLGSALLLSSPNTNLTAKDKAYYLDENKANFVRPGLQFKITKAEIANDGTIKVNFKIMDSKGGGLDRAGVTTPGTVSASFIVATIPAGWDKFEAYTTRVQTSPITGKSATQASGQNNGTFRQIAEGEYEYTFSIKAPSNMDRSATHRIGVYGSRNLNEFELGVQYDDDTFDFVPNGSAVTKTRDIVDTATCNLCHTVLAFHGGSRRSMPLCVMCHAESTFGKTQADSNFDPDTGESISMAVMAHRIHAGSSLPSVKAGRPFRIIGNNQSLHDYSKINFPFGGTSRTGGHMVGCAACHERTNATQKDRWLTNPTRAACGSCHDNINFATGEGHLGLPQVSDNLCKNCHTPEGELEFDASIKGAHLQPRFSKMLPGINFEILAVNDGGPGQKPTVTFTIKDDKGTPILPSAMSTLRLYWAGPTTDYAGYVQEDARQAQCSTEGACFWTFSRALPADAKGTYAIYVEGYKTTTLFAGTAKQTSTRDAGENVVHYFSTDGSKPQERKLAVAKVKCNNCHGDLAFHGDQRTKVEGCVVCHNPNTTDVSRRPNASLLPAQSVDFKTMIHRIHTGDELEHEYTVYGNGNIAHDFTEFGYPGDRRDCNACHVGNGQQLPLRPGMLPVQDPRQLLPVVMPETAACTSCHSSRQAKSHALANTSALGESCAACHGPNAEFSVDRVHAR